MKFQYFLKIQDIKNSVWLKRIDWLGQTVIFCSIPIMLILSKGNSDWIIVIFAAQYAMGFWQMASSFVSVVFRGSAFDSKTKHFLVSVGYLLLLGLLIVLNKAWGHTYQEQDFPVILAAIAFFAPPWTLAIYYYTITWRLVFPGQKKRSSFLPHINF
jgi:hypothetical protein